MDTACNAVSNMILGKFVQILLATEEAREETTRLAGPANYSLCNKGHGVLLKLERMKLASNRGPAGDSHGRKLSNVKQGLYNRQVS